MHKWLANVGALFRGLTAGVSSSEHLRRLARGDELSLRRVVLSRIARRQFRWIVSIGLLLAVCAGCQKSPVSPSRPAAEAVSVSIAGWDEIQRLVAGQRGKVVVLDLWATW